jgi:DeoR/GlpR family transcriptional regulator of sugar metabolism
MRREGAADVARLARLLSVSSATVRRDLRELARNGAVDRTHGGAVARRIGMAFEPAYDDKANRRRAEKLAIARAAADLVDEDQVVVLDSGSTTHALALELRRRFHRLTVITTDVQIAVHLSDAPGLEVVLAGGVVRPRLYSVVGPIAEHALEGLRANVTFIGADAVDLETGVTNASLAEVGVKQRVMRMSDRTVLLADHSKFGKVSLARIAPLSAFTSVIVDDDVDEALVEGMSELGLEVRRAAVDREPGPAP